MGAGGSGKGLLDRKFDMRTELMSTLKLTHRGGVALIIAISLLGIFSLLGMYYVRSSELELKKVGLLLDELRIRKFTQAGLNEVLAEIEKRWANGTIDDLLKRGEYEIRIPYYTFVNVGEGKQELSPSETIKVSVKVKILDESGKVNINLAPASVIQKILGVDGETARNLKSSLDPQSGGRYLYVLDEIFERGISLDNESMERVYKTLSTWNAGDISNPIPYLNLNEASSEVLKALFNLNDIEVEKAISGKPYDSIESFIGMLGKDPSSFNIRIGDYVGKKWVFPFTDRSNSFRILLEGELSREISGVAYRRVRYGLEVGIVLVDGKAMRIWNRVLRSV